MMNEIARRFYFSALILIVVAIGSVSFALANEPPNKQSRRPNIVLIVADDLGYGDIACFRGNARWKTVKPAPESVQPAETPHIDRLAAGGLMMTDFHSNDSVCSPTRAAIMTGRYQHRSGVINVLGQFTQATKKLTPPGEEPFVGLRLSETTMAEVLRNCGYRTACIGKWHLGPLESHQPMDQGFDHFFGTSGGADDNFSMVDTRGRTILWRDREAVPASGEYFTDAIASEAIEFMCREDDKPFFVYLSFTAPHLPYFGPNDRKLGEQWNNNTQLPAEGPSEHSHEAYQEIIAALDAAVGRIVTALQKAGLADNTLIVFTSDNGPVDCGSAVPYRGRKTNLYEGGTRVPTIAYWPGHIAEGGRNSTTAISMDLLPTFAAIAGCDVPAKLKLDGVDLAPLWLRGESPAPRQLFWERGTGVHMHNFDRRIFAVRDGNWKLVQGKSDGPLELYDLQIDPRETHDVAAENPQIVARLKKAFDDWKAGVYHDSPVNVDDLIERLKDDGTIKSRRKRAGKPKQIPESANQKSE